MFEIREAVIDDVDGLDVVRRATFPWHTASVETQRNWFRTVPEAARAQRLVVVAQGKLAGFGYSGLNTMAANPGEAVTNILVHPDFYRRGIGSALIERAEAHLRGVGAVRVQSYVLDDPGVLAFAKRHGYEPGASDRWSMVDPCKLPPMPEIPANVTVVTAAEAGPEVVHAIDSVSFKDEPGDVPNAGIAYDEWFERHWSSPDLDHEISLVAYVDGKPASTTVLEVNRATGRAISAGTGTLREFRGMGLAKLLKSISLRKAAELGVTSAYTCNDYSNAPMLAINDWLGYQVIGGSRSVLKSL